jgi:hypothetical protein
MLAAWHVTGRLTCLADSLARRNGRQYFPNKPSLCAVPKRYWREHCRKTWTLASHLIRASNSRSGGHEFESSIQQELGALTKSGETLGVRPFYRLTFILQGAAGRPQIISHTPAREGQPLLPPNRPHKYLCTLFRQTYIYLNPIYPQSYVIGTTVLLYCTVLRKTIRDSMLMLYWSTAHLYKYTHLTVFTNIKNSMYTSWRSDWWEILSNIHTSKYNYVQLAQYLALLI